MSTLHQNDFSKLTRTKIVEVLDVVIYKLELRLQIVEVFDFLDLPIVYPGVEGIESRDARYVLNMLTDEFNDQGFSFLIQGVEQKDKAVSWDKLLEKLKVLRERLNSGNQSSNDSGLKIQKLVIVKPEHGDTLYKIIVNDVFDHVLRISTIQSSWNLLCNVAIHLKVFDPENMYKGDLHYLNANAACKLYKQTHLTPTRILLKENGFIKAAIPIELITQTTFKRRSNKTIDEG